MGKASGVKLSTLQHCKRFHNLCGIHFIESLNGHGGRGLVSEDEVVSRIFKKPLIAKPMIYFQPIQRAFAKMTEVGIASFLHNARKFLFKM